MISRLTGTIVHTDLKYVILDVHGVGYKVNTTVDIASKISRVKASGDKNLNELVTIWTYLAVREDALDLYGFTSPLELSFFELLITISGIGPKTALGILNMASVEALDSAIRSSDTTHLVKVSGVSKKMAEKIVLELKDKMGNMPEVVTRSSEETAVMKNEMKNDADALEALKSLGYNPTEAREALKEIDKSIKNTSEKIKAALKYLGNK